MRAAARPPVRYFMVTVSCLFGRDAFDGPDRPHGAYQNFGVYADSEETTRRLVTEALDGVFIDWLDSEIREMREEELEDPIFAAALEAPANSIWYRSGRVFYTEEPEN